MSICSALNATQVGLVAARRQLIAAGNNSNFISTPLAQAAQLNGFALAPGGRYRPWPPVGWPRSVPVRRLVSFESNYASGIQIIIELLPRFAQR
jgi:hypothetical protein